MSNTTVLRLLLMLAGYMVLEEIQLANGYDSPAKVNCGCHIAESCVQCGTQPYMCNGDCVWKGYKCVSKNVYLNMRIRKEVSSLTPHEKIELQSALREAKISGTYHHTWPIKNGQYFNSSYNAAAAFHGYPGLCGGSPCCIHGDPRFLPWHRLFMVQLENALRQNKKYSHITLPYWDWTQKFTKLPPLVADKTMDNNGKIENNPFYHSQIPGKSYYTKRSPQILIEYNDFNCTKNPHFCHNYTYTKYPNISKLGDMVLTALEETNYKSFEAQIEHPHNKVHNELGFTPPKPECFQHGKCYNYTMKNLIFSSYDPIFLIFHTMVDYQWAIFQALQKYRCKLLGENAKTCPYSYENDHHACFTAELHPFNSDVYNQDEDTKKYTTGEKVVNYTQSLGYKYKHLKLFGLTIPKLDKFLTGRGNIDRLFAGFSLPDMNIERITFNICHPFTNCIYSSPDFSISKIHGNQEAVAGVFKNKLLVYFDVTKYLPQFGLYPSQDITFKIVSSSIPTNVTFTHVSIFRKAKTKIDRITINWRNDTSDYDYAPFFKTRPNQTTSLRFLSEKGMLVFKYSDRESFQSCSNPEEVNQEIEIKGTQTYFFQNPLMPCMEKYKLQVSTSKPDDSSVLHKFANGSGTIKWVEDMSCFKDSICMENGTYLTFIWTEGNHNVKRLYNLDDFKHCKNYTTLESTSECLGTDQQHPERTITYPQDTNGFQKDEEYYMVCPCWGHCGNGMKLKINIKDKC